MPHEYTSLLFGHSLCGLSCCIVCSHTAEAWLREIPSEMAGSVVGVDGRALKKVFSKLVDGLKATDIIDELFEKDLLILDEYTGILEACSQSSTKEDSRNVNRRVLTAILRRPPGFVAELVAILRKKDMSLANALENGERHYERFVCMLYDAYEGVDLVAQLVVIVPWSCSPG